MSQTMSDLAAIRAVISDKLQYGYAETINSQPLWWNELTDPASERTPDKEITFTWLQDRITLRERLIEQAPLYRRYLADKATIKLRAWENGLRATVFEITSGRLSKLALDASEIGAGIARKGQDMMVEAFRLGDTSAYPMYDGQNLYANAHPKGGTTYDNLLGALTLDATGIETVLTAMRQFPSDEGTAEPLDLIGTHLWAPPTLDWTAKRLLSLNQLPIASTAGVFGTAGNVLYSVMKPITDARLTDTNDWGICSVSGFAKPFVGVRHETEGDPTLLSQDTRDGNNEAYREHWEYAWVIRYLYTEYPTHPYRHIKVVN